ncbi:MAG: hypothetical protein VB087_01280 [Candidatus Limiplasma sp.]|nr:hypothetical protein [Candidatus Limiplasma sp.]
MKRMLVLLLIVALFLPAMAYAEVDLTGMSYDELVALKGQIDLAIWASDEWQEVSVPVGVYTVGEDIPAGKWTIRAADASYITIKWGDELSDSGVDLDYGDLYEYEALYSPTYRNYDERSDRTEISYEIKDGQYVIIDNGTAVFTPYAGKQSLGFK